jgi:uncharacterized protein YraI
MTDTLTALQEIGRSLGVDVDAPFKHPAPVAVPMTTTAPLNVRTGPSVTYPAIRQLYVGETVYVLESSNGWARIGDNQWCSEEYLR